ncbi:MAG: Minf_1886 family protein [Lentisphaeria bacterium]
MELVKSRDEILQKIIAEDARYPSAAYDFVSRAVQITSQEMQRKSRNHELKHISGVLLLDGMRQLLLGQYGCMAIDVLNAWNIKTTNDFGNLVFNMVKGKLLGVSRDDSISDFDHVFDFYDAFVHPFVPKYRAIKPMPVLS